MISILLILQLIAHFLSDFIFQSDKFAIQKNKKGVDSKYLYIHILITFIFSYALSFQWQFFMAALVISLLHFVIDVLKSVLIQKQVFPKLLFFIDQFLHLMIIVAVVYKYQQYYQIDYIYFSLKYLLILLGFIVTAKPANIFIKEIFKAFDISVGKTADLPNAGKLIGVIERWLYLFLSLLVSLRLSDFCWHQNPF